MKHPPANQCVPDGDHSVRLPEQTILQLEELRLRTGQESVADVIREAAELYARWRAVQEVASYEQLTPRLREVLRMIADGSSTKKIAADLRISPKTVEHHRAQLTKRLGIHTIAGLVRYAVRVGAVLP